MASNAGSSSDASTSQPESPRPQAGPLPTKRGEIGFNVELHGHLQSPTAADSTSTNDAPMPERHPADRDAPPAIDADVEAQAGAAAPALVDTAAGSSAAFAPSVAETDSTHSSGKRSFVKFFHSKAPMYGGIRLTTLLLFIFQVLFASGTIAGWILASIRIAKATKNNGNNQNSQMFGAASTTIFVNVLFAVATIVEAIFLERRLFRLRAERWMHLHPGEMMPTRGAGRRGSGEGVSMGFAPWNRPPLPTYARALADSGFGTGDVEDHIIAAPPPPAYGNTRGSTLILAGFLRESLRAQRPVSEHSQMQQTPTDRPVSYVSTDEQWQEIQDAERARKLEETLATLDHTAGNGRSARATNGTQSS